MYVPAVVSRCSTATRPPASHCSTRNANTWRGRTSSERRCNTRNGVHWSMRSGPRANTRASDALISSHDCVAPSMRTIQRYTLILSADALLTRAMAAVSISATADSATAPPLSSATLRCTAASCAALMLWGAT